MVALRVIGVDVEPGCMGRQRCFSVAVVENGRLIAKYEHVPAHKLVRLVWEFRPRVIAVDNVYELGESEREVAKLASLLPEDTEIVQVTVGEDGAPVDLRVLAASAGMEVHGKLSPSRTAYLLALLAERGYGVRVRFLEEKTKIVVSRSRSPGKGGSSSSRFQRNVRASILRAVRDIKRALDRNRLDYDLVFRKSGGGLDSAVFIVYAPRDKLYGLVKPRDDGTVRVEVKPVYGHLVLEKQRYAPEGRRLLIVGVDPGQVTGVAAVDLSGRLVFVTSRRGMDRQEVVEVITRHGVPLVVATDVKPAPDFVKKLAAALGAQLYEPPEPLSVEEKRELVAKHARGLKLDSHERDALAAALRAYNYYADKVKQIESAISKYGIDIDAERVIANVIRGVTVAEAVEREIARLLYSDEEPGYVLRRVRHEQPSASRPSSVAREAELERLRSEVERLRAENLVLRKQVEQLRLELEERERELRIVRNEVNAAVEAERRIQQLRHELELVRRELERVRAENAELRRRLAELDKLVLGLLAPGRLPALVVRNLSRDSLRLVASLRPRVLVVEEAGHPDVKEVAKTLRRAGTRVVIALGGAEPLRSELSRLGLAVLEGSPELVPERVGAVAAVDGERLSDALAGYALSLGHAEEARPLSAEKLKKMFEEYRLRRLSELMASDEGLEDAELALDEEPG